MEQRQDDIRRERSKIDTIEWSMNEDRVPIDDETPLKGRSLPKSQMKSTYNVDVLVPFRANGFKVQTTDLEINAFQRRFVNFYAGMNLALDDLRRQGISLNVRIHDTEYEEQNVQSLFFNGELRNSDLVIGPYKKESVKWLSERMNASETTMISPWISSTSIAEDNPFYIQTKPGLIQHYKTMLYNVLERHPNSDIYLITKEGDDNKERYFEYVSQALELDPERNYYEVLSMEPDTLTQGIMAFDSTFFLTDEKCDKVFMVPYASGRDATFVYDFLRRIQIEGLDCECKVYGMYRWLEFQDQMFELMNAMPVYLTISNLVNPANDQVRSFKKRYFQNYGAYPSEDAYEGYDLMMYAGTSLYEKGNYFQFSGDDAKAHTGLQTVFDVQPEVNEDNNRVEYFENQFIDIIEIDDYQYRRSR